MALRTTAPHALDHPVEEAVVEALAAITEGLQWIERCADGWPLTTEAMAEIRQVSGRIERQRSVLYTSAIPLAHALGDVHQGLAAALQRVALRAASPEEPGEPSASTARRPRGTTRRAVPRAQPTARRS